MHLACKSLTSWRGQGPVLSKVSEGTGQNVHVSVTLSHACLSIYKSLSALSLLFFHKLNCLWVILVQEYNTLPSGDKSTFINTFLLFTIILWLSCSFKFLLSLDMFCEDWCTHHVLWELVCRIGVDTSTWQVCGIDSFAWVFKLPICFPGVPLKAPDTMVDLEEFISDDSHWWRL